MCPCERKYIKTAELLAAGSSCMQNYFNKCSFSVDNIALRSANRWPLFTNGQITMNINVNECSRSAAWQPRQYSWCWKKAVFFYSFIMTNDRVKKRKEANKKSRWEIIEIESLHKQKHRKYYKSHTTIFCLWIHFRWKITETTFEKFRLCKFFCSTVCLLRRKLLVRK